MNPEMRRVVDEADAAARRGWNDSDVATLATATSPLRADELELQRLLALPIADHGFREDVLTTDPEFHASVFAMNAGETIPLHDHPQLDVITKVLRGRVRVRTYEWIEETNLVARECGEAVIGDADDALVLRKAPGTLHTVTAIEPAAFLDLFAPYYDDDLRPCRYYVVEDAAAERRRPGGWPGGVPPPSGSGGPGSRDGAVRLRLVSWEEAHACPAP